MTRMTDQNIIFDNIKGPHFWQYSFMMRATRTTMAIGHQGHQGHQGKCIYQLAATQVWFLVQLKQVVILSTPVIRLEHERSPKNTTSFQQASQPWADQSSLFYVAPQIFSTTFNHIHPEVV